MSQQPTENIGVVDAYLRLFGGFTLLALGAGRKLGKSGSVLAVLFGASKVAEGITRYCPILDLMDLTTLDGSVRRRERIKPVGLEAHQHEDSMAGQGPDESFVARTFPWDEGQATGVATGVVEEATRPSTPLAQDENAPPERTGRPFRQARPAIKLKRPRD